MERAVAAAKNAYGSWKRTSFSERAACMRKFVEGLKSKQKEPFTADFVCTLVLTFPNGSEKIFEGRVSGKITWPMKGIDGHGYDPIFIPDGYNKTFGEMSDLEKNDISHRNKALKKFVSFYNNYKN